MRISDWSSDVCSSDLGAEDREVARFDHVDVAVAREGVAGLAHRADDRGGHFFALRLDRDEIIDRKSVVEGKSVSVSVELGGRRIIKKKITSTATVTGIHKNNIRIRLRNKQTHY